MVISVFGSHRASSVFYNSKKENHSFKEKKNFKSPDTWGSDLDIFRTRSCRKIPFIMCCSTDTTNLLKFYPCCQEWMSGNIDGWKQPVFLVQCLSIKSSCLVLYLLSFQRICCSKWLKAVFNFANWINRLFFRLLKMSGNMFWERAN